MDPNEQAEAVVGLLRDLLGDELIGVYLHGSSVLGGLKPHSDVDLMAVAGRPMTTDEKHALIGRLMPISGRGDTSGRSRPIELFVLVRDAVRPWRYPPSLDLLYGDWWRVEYQRGELPWRTPNPDLTIQIEMAFRADRAIFGPSIATVLDPVPPQDVRRAMRDGIPELLGYLDGDEANVVLTFARIWFSLETGEIGPKDLAAGWAIERLPEAHRRAVAHARSIYLGDAPDEWGSLLPTVRPAVTAMRASIERTVEGPIPRLTERPGR
jgi:predicted nucleotidyltransferase